jgi:hypothetical protein
MVAFTPAAHAVTNGCLPAIKYLVNHGADVRKQRSKGNITLLHTAALLGMKEELRSINCYFSMPAAFASCSRGVFTVDYLLPCFVQGPFLLLFCAGPNLLCMYVASDVMSESLCFCLERNSIVMAVFFFHSSYN